MDRRPFLIVGAIGIALAGAGLLFRSNLYLIDILTLVVIWALASTAWNLVGGYQNQLALGHSAFFALGAYASTMLYVYAGITPWVGVWVGALAGAAASAFVAWLCLRMKGAFYALATFALSQVAFIVANIWTPVTGGAEGIAISYEPSPLNWIFESHLVYLELYVAILVAFLLLTAVFAQSRLGLASIALSADEEAASALGIRVLRAKVIAAAISGALTAIAGTAYAQYVLFVHPSSVAGVNYSIQVALLALFGGVATIYGPVLGALILVPLAAFLTLTLTGTAATVAPGLTNIVYGTILMITFLFIPRGIGPTAIGLLRRLRSRRPPAATTETNA
jgi:branched-chain amino acid transport system permease protein